MAARTRGQVLRMGDARSAARARCQAVQDRLRVEPFRSVVLACTGRMILGHRHRVCH
ncbi:hypothetical protein DUI70_2935 [Streptomyces albus]|nr:hypothetical protein DUI70_2935 [Streptomyces albus]